MNWFRLSAFSLCIIFLASCQKSNRIRLDIDYSRASSWHYLLGVDIKGLVSAADTQQTFTSSARIYLDGEKKSGNDSVAVFRTREARINSNFLSEQERENLQVQFDNMTLAFAPAHGTVLPVDSAAIPVVLVGGWDLVKSFARVLPVFPVTPVRPGSVWDREHHFPIETSYGRATGHLFQSFTFDSVFLPVSSVRHASLSWRFSYKIEPPVSDSGSALSMVPLSGTGTGVAIIDLDQRCLVKAHAFFEVPASDRDQIKINWNESVHLELIK